MDHKTNPYGHTLHKKEEPKPVGRLVGYPASCGLQRSRQAMILRGRHQGVRNWLSTLAMDGQAPGWGLAMASPTATNNEDADDLLSALEADGLITRGVIAHHASQQAFLSLMPGHGKHYRYPREYWWHLAPGAGNAIVELMSNRKK